MSRPVCCVHGTSPSIDHGAHHRGRDRAVHRDRLAGPQRPRQRRPGDPRAGSTRPSSGSAARTSPGPVGRDLRAVPVRADRLLRADRDVDRRDARVARPAADPQRRRGQPARVGAAPAGHAHRRWPGRSCCSRPSRGPSWSRCGPRGFPFVVVDPRTSPPRDIVAVSATHAAGARGGHRPPGRARPPPHRGARPVRRTGWPRPRGWPGTRRRWPRSGSCRHRIWSATASRRSNTATGRRATCWTATTGRPRWSRSTTRRRSARWPPPPNAACNVPGDLSVAGFDDIDLARATRPLLTTVRQPLAEMGRMAVSLLMRLVERHRLTPCTWSWRPSWWCESRPDEGGYWMTNVVK